MKLYFIAIFMGLLTITVYSNSSFATCCEIRGSNSLSPVSPDLFLVNGNSVEKVMLGKSMKEVYTLYPSKRIERVLIYDARGSYEKIEILSRDRSEVLFFIEPDCSSQDSACIIKRINITSSTYHTKKNLRVGKYFVDLVKSGEKINELTWFEGNLIIRGKEAGLSYVMQTVNIPKPWYSTMDQNTLPDSTKIIGMMITGKDLKGVSYLEVDSLNKKSLASIALKKLNTVAKQTPVKKLKKGAKKKETLPPAAVKESATSEVEPTTSASLSLTGRQLLPPMPPQPGNQQQNLTAPAGQQTPPMPPQPGNQQQNITAPSGQQTPPMPPQPGDQQQNSIAPAGQQFPLMPPQQKNQQQNSLALPGIKQIKASTLQPGISQTDKSILIESGSDTTKTKTFPDPATVK